MTARQYSSIATPTKIVGAIDSTQDTFTVSALSGYPSNTPWTAALDPDTDNEELVDVTAVAGNVLTVTRGVAGTTNIGHADGAAFEHRTSHRDYQEPQDHIAATSDVHGVTGALVGADSAQTFTNKTINGTANTLTNIPNGALDDLAISKVVNLQTDLDAKLNTPATAWSAGALLVGTGTDAYDLITGGVEGQAPTIQANGSLAFGTPGFWQDYTPTFATTPTSTMSMGNSTVVARYAQSGKIVHVRLMVTFGSTYTSAGSGNPFTITLPVAPVTGALFTGTFANYTSAAGGIAQVGHAIVAPESPAVIRLQNASTPLGPNYFTVNYVLVVNMTYEAA